MSNINKSLPLAKKYIHREPMPSSLEHEFRSNGMAYMLDSVYIRTAELVEDNMDAGKKLMNHLQQILPCIAFYEALLEKEADKDKALVIYGEWALKKVEKMARMIPAVFKIPGLYKLLPRIFYFLMKRNFGPQAGFEINNVSCDDCFEADVISCPYLETCRKYGCEEIVQFFCKSDDIAYGNIHPKVIWGRTKTLGTGGDCCNFRVYIK